MNRQAKKVSDVKSIILDLVKEYMENEYKEHLKKNVLNAIQVKVYDAYSPDVYDRRRKSGLLSEKNLKFSKSQRYKNSISIEMQHISKPNKINSSLKHYYDKTFKEVTHKILEYESDFHSNIGGSGNLSELIVLGQRGFKKKYVGAEGYYYAHKNHHYWNGVRFTDPRDFITYSIENLSSNEADGESVKGDIQKVLNSKKIKTKIN